MNTSSQERQPSSQIQSYFDLYELFSQIKIRYNLQSYLDWIGQTLDNYKFLNLSQQYISSDYWKKSIKIVISQYSSEINTFLKNLKSKTTYSEFDPHNQISGFGQISTSLKWINSKSNNNYIQLTDSFRIIESLMGKETINLICCATNLKNVGVCFIPVTSEIETFLSYYNFNLSKLNFFDLMQIIQILKTYIKRNQSTKLKKSIKHLNIKPFDLSSTNNDTCLNHLKTHFSGLPFELINTQQTNTIQITSDGVAINQSTGNTSQISTPTGNNTINPSTGTTSRESVAVKPVVSNSGNKESSSSNNEQNRDKDDVSSEFCIENKYIIWIEDVSMLNNIILACYINF